MSHALLESAVALCGQSVAPRLGVQLATVHDFSRDFQRAARALGFGDTSQR